MKLLRIAVDNLNSLYGHHEVDLEGQFRGEPLFLITGPTGAGKSTLMDAVSLALFGQTPRLAGGRGEADEAPGLIVSRGAGEAAAELEFSRLEHGRVQRYRASWRCRRARGKADGELQGPVRSLERQRADGTWEMLVSSATAKVYQPHFSAALDGMTVHDFKRAVLLAQGEFAAFLRATEDERAAILERLTETGRYLAIGQLANARRQQAKEVWELADASLRAVQVMPAEEEAALRGAVTALAQVVADGRLAVTASRTVHGWLVRRDELQAAVATAVERVRAAQEQQIQAAPELARLADHERCAAAAEVLTLRDRAERDLESSKAQLPAWAEALTKSTATLEETRPIHAERTNALEARLAEVSTLGPVIGSARAVRITRDQRAKALAAALVDWQGCARLAEKAKDALQKAQTALHVAQEAANPSELPDLPAVDDQLAVLQASLQAAQDAAEARKSALATHIAAAREALEQSQLIQELAGQRLRLTPGHACPLCGSEDHPLVRGGRLAALDAAELAKSTALRTDITTWTAQVTDIDRETHARTKAHGVAVQQVVEAQQRREAVQREVTAKLALVTTAEVSADAAQAALAKSLGALALLREEVASLDAQVAAVLEGRDPDVVQRTLDRGVEDARQALTSVAETLQRAEAGHTRAQTELASGQARISGLTDELRVRDQELGTAVAALGLSDVAALRVLLLDLPTLARLRTLKTRVDTALSTALALQEAQNIAMAQHHLAQPTDLAPESTVEAAAAALRDLETRWQEDTATLATQTAALRQCDDQRAQREQLQRDATAKQAELTLWTRLHNLIGTGNGQAFQRFAQILNMEELADKANHHLRLLSPRYALVAATQGGEMRLDFAVRDTFQADEVRPLTTLSGGETFLVSLALALALADYRSVRMPVETLLLDEGFGTLDPQTLGMAIAALKTLNQRGGVQVGLISHVDALKQEIPAWVVVEALGNGRSTVRMVVGGPA